MKEVQALKQAPNPEEAALHQKNIAMLTQQLAQLHAVPDPQGGPLVRDPGPASTATGTPERQTSATSPARSYFNGRPKAGDAAVNIGGTVYRHTPGTALAGVAFNRALSDATKRAGIPDMPPARTSGAGAHSTPRPNPAYASWYAKYGRAYNDIHRKLSTVYDK